MGTLAVTNKVSVKPNMVCALHSVKAQQIFLLLILLYLKVVTISTGRIVCWKLWTV